MSIAIAKNHMAEMNMLGMLAVLDKTLTEATRDKISYSEFADLLLQAEADYRQERKTVNRIKAAKFTVRPAFEDFDFTAERSITKAEIKEIYTLGWLNDARPLLLIGETGVGKTFIAQAVGLHACASGKSVLYAPVRHGELRACRKTDLRRCAGRGNFRKSERVRVSTQALHRRCHCAMLHCVGTKAFCTVDS